MDRIPKELKKYIKKARASKKRENKLVEQNQIVIVGSDKKTSKRKRTTKPKPTDRTSDYPRIVYIPQVSAPAPMSTPSPQQQPQPQQQQEQPPPIPQMAVPFAQEPAYNNPFQAAPRVTPMNPAQTPYGLQPAPFTDLEAPPINQSRDIYTPELPKPNPVMSPIVEEINNRNFLSKPPTQFLQATGIPTNRQQDQNPFGFNPTTPVATEIPSSQAPVRFEVMGYPVSPGFVENQAVNDLDRQVSNELADVRAYGESTLMRGGGAEGPAPSEIPDKASIGVGMYYTFKYDRDGQERFSAEDKKMFEYGRRMAAKYKSDPYVINLKSRALSFYESGKNK